MDWYKFTPVDTLFFRGAEPMNIGENHTTSRVFPPPAHTLSGALRTAVLIQNNVLFEEYGRGNIPSNILEAIGQAGKTAPFSLVGPLFMQDKAIYVPAPYNWFMDKEGDSRKARIISGRPVKSPLLKSERPEFLWAKGENTEMVSIGGMWIEKSHLQSGEADIEVKRCEDFFENEPRTGIALEKSRRVREGHLYSFNHARLNKNVSIVFGVDKPLPIADQGALKVGAEQRFGWYEKLGSETVDLDFSRPGDLFMSLSVVEGLKEANSAVIATGKIQYYGGWDLKIGFHKPMTGFFPAGTVFNKNLNSNFLTIKGE